MTKSLNLPVFVGSTLIIAFIVVLAVIFPTQSKGVLDIVQASVLENWSWFYILAVATILLVVVFLMISSFGDIRLGLDDSRPEYSHISWFAMLFSAGMGIGLMFFGVAEPVMHFLSPPVGDGSTIQAAQQAMKITFFHWGLHAWAIYAIVAVILAFFAYRHNLPLTLRSALYPIIGDKIYGKIGHAVDIFAVIGTLFGVATSLGYGVLQLNSGLNHLFGVEIGMNTQVVLIIAVTLLATLSVATGLDKGIKILSETNILLAVVLLVFIWLFGSSVFLLKAFVQNVGAYASDLLGNTFNLFAYEKTDWIGGWTIFYWAWWISWSPFVGLFIARISKGRTIREFALGVLFVPTGFTLLWMTFFGNSGIDMILNKGFAELGQMVSSDVSLALYVFLEKFPFSFFVSIVATIMVVVFFVTSADSGAMVIDMLCSNGNNQTPLWQRIFWAFSIGIVAISLLLAGGLSALQTMTIASALPFTFVLLVAIYGLLKALKKDVLKKESKITGGFPSFQTNNGIWQERLSNIVQTPTKKHVKSFLEKVVLSAMKEVGTELEKLNLHSKYELDLNAGFVKMTLDLGQEQNFLYGVKLASEESLNILDIDEEDTQRHFKAEVFLLEGGQDYNIMGWSKSGVINDIVDQYQKHMSYLRSIN